MAKLLIWSAPRAVSKALFVIG